MTTAARRKRTAKPATAQRVRQWWGEVSAAFAEVDGWSADELLRLLLTDDATLREALVIALGYKLRRPAP